MIAESTPWDVVVVGAGAAGLLAAARAAERGKKTLLLEKNTKPGVKILMSGGTRCNLTHAVDRRGIIEAFGKQGRFLHSALAALGPNDLVDLFESEGMKTKIEETGKIFPASDKAADVLAALCRRLDRSGAVLALDEGVLEIASKVAGSLRDPEKSSLRDEPNESRSDSATLVKGFTISTSRRTVAAEKLILTTGGQSYPGCGTTGDGYVWAKSFGHSIVPPRPSLVPLTTGEKWVNPLRGVTVTDVGVRILREEQTLDERRGSFLFTHFGVSGPAVLDVSRTVTAAGRSVPLTLSCDFLPSVNREELLSRLQSEAATAGKKQIAGIVGEWLPRRLVEALMQRAGISMDRRAAEFTRAERDTLARVLKETCISIAGTLGFKKAEVTAGGVSLDEIDSRTMQSKLAKGLYLAGEILDLDGPIGGYNFQSAFSTGRLAGESV